MNLKIFKIIVGLFVASFCSRCFSAQAGPVRISFLRDEASLRDTLELLSKNGCKEEAVDAFKRATAHYYATNFFFDFSKFPQPQDGFYSFPNTPALVAALPHKLTDTQHGYELNCFDLMIVLAGNRLRTGLRPDEVFNMFFFTKPTTNGSVTFAAATARDMFSQIYPPWYLKETEAFIPKTVFESRIVLTATLFRNYLLPLDTSESKLNSAMSEVLHSTWQNEKMTFPKRVEAVLCHEVNFTSKAFATTHAALLLHRKKGYTYLEKAGGSGPFVRIDFDNRADLLPWLSAMFKGLENEYTHLFVSFNDTKIIQLDAPK